MVKSDLLFGELGKFKPHKSNQIENCDFLRQPLHFYKKFPPRGCHKCSQPNWPRENP